MERNRVSFMIPDTKNSDIRHSSKLDKTTSLCKYKKLILKELSTDERFNYGLLRKIVVLKDILRDLPEIEHNLVSSIYSRDENDRISLPARVITSICSTLFILVIYGSIFVIGLIIASYITSPIPIYGRLMWHHVDDDIPEILQKIFLIPPGSSNNYLTIKGSFFVAYHLYNNTPYSGSLSLYMNASYLPQSNTKMLTTEYCFGKHSYPKLGPSIFDNFKDKKLKFTAKSDVNNIPNNDESKGRLDYGNLISLDKVIHLQRYDDVNIHLPESSIYENFITYPIAGNRIEMIPEVYQGLNEVRLVITLDSKIKLDNNNEIASRLLSDCRNGFLILKFTSIAQRFDTMLFSGTSMPTNFLPIRIPCSISVIQEAIDKVTTFAKVKRRLYNNQRHILKKLNVSLNI
ncbi:hypothetical protein BEWA_018790 [Theileria equi strain WA]|uniref:Uncharacterized protein n=1 Tax=Theileria equi strain WA TaxID=1537102 RepID=L0AVW6_THEEQ|nr:hypothetical protein BEWA_018790 [Theileria equi strain WA]AFZ79034.1 hypothetical protein BEWA_018790 [Theileria equi strain WA]|eukprot:XP_004828700.1 hypothetical protein BEWA_018790 [Theileria equi strain WA]